MQDNAKSPLNSEKTLYNQKQNIENCILFIDSDDYIELDLVSFCVEKMMEHKCQIVRFNHRLQRRNGEIKIQPDYFNLDFFNDKVVSGEEYFKNYTHYCFAIGWGCLFDAEFILRNNLHFKEGMVAEDAVFGLQVFGVANKIYFTNKILLTYRYNETSTMHDTSFEKKKKLLLGFHSVVLECDKYMRENRQLEGVQKVGLQNIKHSLGYIEREIFILPTNEIVHLVKSLENFKDILPKRLKRIYNFPFPRLFVLYKKFEKSIKNKNKKYASDWD